MELSHLDKLYFKKDKIRKGDVIQYYTDIAPYILPYLKNRPLVMRRFPEGIDGVNFVQKEAGVHLPSFVKTVAVEHDERTVAYLVVNTLRSLLYAVNLGSIELHPFNAPVKHLDKPTYFIIDLDPEGVQFNKVVDVALCMHALLDDLSIPHFCKTSGGRGLHIYIPLGSKYTHEQAKEFAHVLVSIVHAQLPAITSLERSPKKRQRKVYLDYLQNNPGQTVVAPYSIRGRPGAPVSTPLEWKEVRHGLDPKSFTLKNTRARLKRKGDLFKGVLGRGINLKACLKKLEKKVPQTPAPTEKKLKAYAKKRDFTKTKEPSDRASKGSGKEPIFVIQKHAASHLHFDLRLEMKGTLVSWAVPKGPSLNPAVKRLAIAVEDHPMAYADFEGTIPKGQYGGGTVMVWDQGTYELLEKKKDYLEFELKGKKLNGIFVLVHTANGDGNQWLLIKKKDKWSSSKKDPVKTGLRSALTGRTMGQIGKG